ncbi:hypothetical protein C9E91_01300 [Rhizobium sp. SEMIA4064]|nr:hypothetical protein C9E91_01300 [Rhizobium sp. SEMIA4064]
MLDHDLGPFGIKAERRNFTAGLTYLPATPFHRLGIHMGAPVNCMTPTMPGGSMSSQGLET